MVELRRELGLVREHRDEVFVVGQVRQDLLDRDDLLEALDAGARLVDLGHPAAGDPLQELVLAEPIGTQDAGRHPAPVATARRRRRESTSRRGGGTAAPAGGLARGSESPESVSERILSTSVSEGAAFGDGGDEGAKAARRGSPACRPVRSSRQRVLEALLHVVAGPAGRRRGRAGAAGAADCGGGGAEAGARALRGRASSRPARRARRRRCRTTSAACRRRRAGTCRCASSARRCRTDRAPRRTSPRKSSSVNGRARMSNAPIFWASAFGLSPR